MRGNGRIFQRKGSAFLWCAYYLRGKEYRESTGETDPNKAEKFLKRRLKEVGADQIGAKAFVGPQQERIKFSELLDALEADYKLRGKDSPQVPAILSASAMTLARSERVALTAEQVDHYIERTISGRGRTRVHQSGYASARTGLQAGNRAQASIERSENSPSLGSG